MYTITVRSEFNSAHRLRDYHGKCEDLHGHNWSVEVSASGLQLDHTGMVVDFTKLKKDLADILDELDHKFLNDLDYFKKINPTSENIAKWIYDNLKSSCQKYNINLAKVTVWETSSSSACYEEN